MGYFEFNYKRLKSGFLLSTLALTLSFSPITAEPVPTSIQPSPVVETTLKLIETVPITSGAVRKRYTYENAQLEVIEADLNNPYLEVNALSPQGMVATRGTVTDMVAQQGAVAGINADFFNINGEGAPLGTMMNQGVLITSPVKLNAIYSLGITTSRTARIEQFAFAGTVTSPLGTSFSLSGINKTPYYEEPNGIHSHVNQLHLYTEHWRRPQRGHDTLTTPTEVLVTGGIVQSIHLGSYYPGVVPPGSLILRGHGTAAKFLEANAQVGQALSIDYKLAPEDQWQMIIGGHSLLVDQGKPVVYGRSLSSIASTVARSAAGVSQDGKTLYLIGVARSGNSKGLTIKQLSAVLPQLGVFKGLNLDGGGSTAMVTRPLGETSTSLAFPTQEATQRPVVNAIGLFTKAPLGTPAGGVIAGPKDLLVGQPAAFDFKAYDNYFNPIGPGQVAAVWQEALGLGAFDANTFVATQPGNGQITAQLDALKLTYPIRILDRDQIRSLSIVDLGNPSGLLTPLQRQLKIEVETMEGNRFEAPVQAFSWDFNGFSGALSPQGVLDVANAGPGTSITANYRGFRATLPIEQNGDRTLLSMENLKGITFQKSPSTVLGYVDVVADPLDSMRNVVRLSYDFTLSQGTQAAYLTLPSAGVALSSGARALKISTYGQQGGEWLRAELKDGKGKLHRVTLASKVDWMGWKQLEIPLEGMASPITLTRLYAVGLETDWQLANRQGLLLFKDLSVNGPLGPSTPTTPKEQLTLTLGSKIMLKGETRLQMDTAPVSFNGRTLVPLRFVSESLGGKITWHPDTKNAAIWQYNRWVDLWYNVNYMVRSGKRMELDVAPSLIGGRLMIPLRAVAESLDVKVLFDGSTKQIILN